MTRKERCQGGRRLVRCGPQKGIAIDRDGVELLGMVKLIPASSPTAANASNIDAKKVRFFCKIRKRNGSVCI